MEGGVDPLLTFEEPPPHARQEEDRVVGDDPEQEHDHDRLHVAGHRDAHLLAHPRRDPDRDEVGDRRREERDERGAERAEVEAQDREDDEHGGERHPGEVAVDLLPLGEPGRNAAGDADERVVRLPGLDRGPVVGDARLVADRRLALEEEERDRGRRVLARAGDELEGVQERERERDAVVLTLAGLDRAVGDAGLRFRAQPVGIALDDCRLRDDGDVEELGRAPARLHRLRVLGHEVGELRALGLLEARQVERRRDGADDPRGHDEPAQAHDELREGPGPHGGTTTRRPYWIRWRGRLIY